MKEKIDALKDETDGSKETKIDRKKERKKERKKDRKIDR